MRYANIHPDDASERALLKELAAERRGFRRRRLREMARPRGVVMNLKKVHRLCKEERLTVRRCGGRKRAFGTRAPLESGRRFRVFSVEEQFTLRSLGVEIDTCLPGRRIVRVLVWLLSARGRLAMIVSYNGIELTCNAMLKWATEASIS